MATTKVVGTAVKLIAPVISGVVKEIKYNNESNSLEMLVEYVDAEGETHTRWFAESQLEAV